MTNFCLTTYRQLKVVILILCCLIGWNTSSIAQERCGSSMSRQEAKAFEKWLTPHYQKTLKRRTEAKAFQNNLRRDRTKYQIPIVVHIIHNGEAIGIGPNISDEQILSQIESTNKDLSNTHHLVDNTLEAFKDLAGDSEISLVFAKQDPEGQPTNGIVRINGGRINWTQSEQPQFKALSHWPSDQYLNIYVINFNSSLFGFAQFPTTALTGLTDIFNNSSQDGIVIGHTAFGSNEGRTAANAFNLKTKFDLGRTLTHEFGHILGLLHTWGEGGCEDDDYVADTPVSSKSSSGCDLTKKTCSTLDMTQNYLDYSDDECMTLYTKGQILRMQTVLENNNSRKTLLTSKALQAPQSYALDLGVKTIIINSNPCHHDNNIDYTLKNYGSTKIESAKVSVYIDDILAQEETKSLNLNKGQSDDFTFSNLLFETGAHVVKVQIDMVNGTDTDERLDNQERSTTIVYSSGSALPLTWDASTIGERWKTKGPWTTPTVATKANLQTKVFSVDLKNDKAIEGNDYFLISPLSPIETGYRYHINFNFAYGNETTDLSDQLFVGIVSCNTPIEDMKLLKTYSFDALKTMALKNPTSALDWNNASILIPRTYAFQNVRVFVGVRSVGIGQLFIDALEISKEKIKDYDIVISSSQSKRIFVCDGEEKVRVLFENNGLNTLKNLKIMVTSGSWSDQITLRKRYLANETIETFLPIDPSITKGAQEYTISVEENTSDELLLIDQLTVQFANNFSPFKEAFHFESQNAFQKSWLFEDPSSSWQEAAVKSDYQGLEGNAISILSQVCIAKPQWLISPFYDVKGISEGYFVFDVAYAFSEASGETLEVLSRTNCDQDFNNIIKIFSRESLGKPLVGTSFSPSSKNDWKRITIELKDHLTADSLQLAMRFDQQCATNFYLDNLRVGESKFEDGVSNTISIYPNLIEGDGGIISLKVQFALNKVQDGIIQIISMKGELIQEEEFTGLSDDILDLEISGMKAGMYLLKFQSNELSKTKRLIVN